jgi:hypothetical protein
VETVWHELVEQARWAPSPHNTQPWRIEVRSEREADLYAERSRLLPVEDPDGRFLTAGLGIFVEALKVVAAARGLHLRYDVRFPALGEGAEERPLFAHLSLAEGAADDDLPPSLLAQRRTSRLPYDGRPASQDALTALERVAAGFGHEAGFSSERELVDWVVALNADTVFYDLGEADRRAEIGHWTHTTNASADRAGDGFSPRCLGFPGPVVNVFFHHHGLFRPRPLRALVRALYLRSMKGTATVGWISGPWRTPEDWFEAGRMFLRFWLTVTQHGLHLHPFGSVITNPTAHARFAEKLAQVESDRRETWLLLRLGYSADPPRSARRPLAEVIA